VDNSYTKDSKKINKFPIYQLGLLEGNNILALLLSPNNFSQGFQISIMKSFAPPPRLRVGLHDIPHSPLDMYYVLLNKCQSHYLKKPLVQVQKKKKKKKRKKKKK
jgi:hypothetical protein